MKTLLTAATFGLIMLPAWGQTFDFNLDAVAAKAKEKAEITLDKSMLDQAMPKVPDKIKDKLGNLSRLVVRHYEFDKPGMYADSDLEGVRKLVSGAPDWSRIINVKDQNETVEIYMQNQAGKTTGFLLIAAEPKELTVVHVVGTVDIASLQEVIKSTIQYDLKSVGGQ